MRSPTFWVLLLVIGMSDPAWAQGRLIQRDATVPDEVSHIYHVDLSGTGRDDLFLLSKKEPREVTVLLAGESEDRWQPRTFPAPLGLRGIAFADMDPEGLPGRDIIFLHENGASLFDFRNGGRVNELLAAPLLFSAALHAPPVFWMWGVDIDGGGRHDLLLPGLETDLLLRGEHLDSTVRIPVPTERIEQRFGGAGFAVTAKRPRTEVQWWLGADKPGVSWTERDGLYHSRFVAGEFQPKECIIPVKVSKKAGVRDHLERRSLSFADVNSDGRLDMIWARTAATSGAIPELRTELLIFRGGATLVDKPKQVLLLPGVLSSGPEIRDINGDGHLDMLLSIYGGGVSNELARRFLGRVSLEYLLYLGSAGGDIARSPHLRLEDKVDTASFEVWGLRHRLLFNLDWNGDGICDLARVAPEEGGFLVTVHRGKQEKDEFHFESDPMVTGTFRGSALSLRAMLLDHKTPCIFVTTAHGAVHLTLEP